jgi:prepilin-type N-terminal cleavage/methylation domain-containing protein
MKTKSGFTIVELLIVIVVIAILATISIVAYNGIQSRARDSARLNNAKDITGSLERYYVFNGNYPNPTSLNGSWEQSDTETAGNFMEYLTSYGFPSGTPLDPTNSSTSGHRYSYYRYGAGSYGCDASRGNFYVFGITRMDSASGRHPQSPGFSCSGRDWGAEFSWAKGSFER